MKRCHPAVRNAPAVVGSKAWQELFRETAECPNPAVPINDTEAILFALAQAVEQRDPYTSRHCERLAIISLTVGMAMALPRAGLLALYRGGYLHDIGKVGLPDSILFNPGKLTPEEWDVMRTHPARGEEICRPLHSLHDILPIIRGHHERWDGSGYPDGLRGEEIPLLARIIQIADIYDALTSDRPYKRAFTAREALDTMREETDRGWRDPAVMSVFLRLHREVISRIDDYEENADRTLGTMRLSMHNMQQVLADEAASSTVPQPAA